MDAATRLGLSVLLLAASRSGLADGFRDDFSLYGENSSGEPNWTVVRGEWKVQGGKFVQRAEGEALAASTRGLPAGGFRIEVRFRTASGIPGEGIVFGFRDSGRPGACHIVRVDPEGLFYGSLDGAGEFRGDGPVPALVEGGVWNTLVVTVSRRRGTYRIEFSGKTAAEGMPLEHTGRFLGLAAGGSGAEFALCAVTEVSEEAGEAKEGSSKKPSGPLSRPVDIAASRNGHLVVLDRESPPVRVLRADLTVASRFGRLLEGDRPVAVEVGPAGEVYVLDGASGRIDRYPPEGGPEGTDPSKVRSDVAPRAIVASPPLKGPRGLAIFPDGRILVAESEAGRVAVLSAVGDRLGEVGPSGGEPGGHERPSDVAIDPRGRVIVADFRACRVQAFAPDGLGSFKLVARSPWMAPPNRLAVGAGNWIAVLGRFAYYETGGAIRYLDSELRPKGFWGGFAAGNISEEGAISYRWLDGIPATGAIPEPSTLPSDPIARPKPEVSYEYLDRKDGRLFRLGEAYLSAADVRPGIRSEEKAVTIEWGPHIGPSSLEYRREGETAWREIRVDRPGFSSRVSIADFDGQIPYEFRFWLHHDVRQLTPRPEGGDAIAWSKPYRFYGPPPAGMTRYLELSVVCAVYLSHEDLNSKRTFTLPRERLGSKLEREYEVARAFFARNSGLRLHVRAEFEVVEGTAARVKNGWIDPSQARRDLAPLLERRKKRVEDFDSVIAMWAEPSWRADLPDDPGLVGGGGLTSFGYSTYGIGGAAAWLFCHEYHHQIDAFFNRSGHLDYPLNHPDATVQPGLYGQHWDCNAFFLRSWGSSPEGAEWFFCRYGKVLLTADADGDGVPDKDPALPFDEARLGTDPSKMDTDGDGLSDLAEVTAGTFHGADPLKPDTDGDGIRDGDDRFPLLRAFSKEAILRRGSPVLDGKIAEGERQELGTIPEPGASIFACWSPEGLHFAVQARRPLRIAFEIDGAADGWFLEEDNLTVELEVDGKEKLGGHLPPGTLVAGAGGSEAPCAEATIPAAALKAGPPAPGRRIALCVRASYREGDSARHRELFLAEPWQLIELRMGE